MPTKMVKYRRDKAVLVSVYVERPRRKGPSPKSNNGHHHHHHHHYVHHSIKQEVTLRKPGDAGKGYDRRAELLLYSQRLRESAVPALNVDVVAEPSPLEPKPVPASSTNKLPSENIVAVQAKPKLTRTTSNPACLCKWKLFIPSSLVRSLTSLRAKKPRKKRQTNSARKGAIKCLELPKKRGFISKLLFPAAEE